MNLTEIVTADSCMRLEAFRSIETREVIRRDKKIGSTRKESLSRRRRFTRRQITELFFENCIDCGKMAAIPQSALAVHKVRCNNERAVSIMSVRGEKGKSEEKENMFKSWRPLEGWELTPLKYNSKLMNSIWGLYNRYSVHNFKKNADAEEGARGVVAAAIWGAILENRPPAANAAATTIADVPRIMNTGSGL
ncbi:LOW QUALITY PROTEIN: uncharacterized protein LOC114932375 [Nylanderia fulva]|uniref:LOW QUALITY PROTEIN: uncharacterized protein LOC114932375 n=1 Tax=Nylanderia fulva TaxID=613905 RepID=UPI0010FB6280|nr:LOW QUALITY PROTEIN: uncharacterized protein LOC114932375 [Nylanderia fulva]